MSNQEIKLILTTDVSGAIIGLKSASGEVFNFTKTTKDATDVCSKMGVSIRSLAGSAPAAVSAFVGINSTLDLTKKAFGIVSKTYKYSSYENRLKYNYIM